MKKNNKGYSLVELVLTLAIFSIIMLAIILMMRTTVASYKDGLFETDMQEEAQIVLNQISDYLIDSVAISADSPTSEDSDELDAAGNKLNKITKTYHIDEGSGAKDLVFEKKVSYDAADSKLYSGKLFYNGQLLSDEVRDFGITGIEASNTNYDNTARIDIEVEYQDRKYEASKDVFFRNNIVESPVLYDLSGKSTIKTGGGGGENEKDVKILRYGNLDITKKYGIIKLTGADANAKTWYSYRVGTSSSYGLDNLNPSDVSSKKAKDGSGIILECNDTLTKSMSISAPTSGDCVVTGAKADGTIITLNLSTDPVSFNTGGADVFVDHYMYSVNNGYHQYVSAKGININNALAAGSTITYDIELSKDTLTKTGSPDRTFSKSQLTWTVTNQNISKNSDGKFGTGGAQIGTDQQPINPGPNVYTKIQVGLLADLSSEGMMITTANDALNSNRANDLHNSTGDQTLKFTVKIKPRTSLGEGVVQEIDPFTYKYYSTGSGLNGYN